MTELLALLPVDQHEGSRAHRLVRDVLVLGVLEDLLGHDAVGEERDVGQERRPRLLQADDHRVVVLGL